MSAPPPLRFGAPALIGVRNTLGLAATKAWRSREVIPTEAKNDDKFNLGLIEAIHPQD
jgi:hypothetical protein